MSRSNVSLGGGMRIPSYADLHPRKDQSAPPRRAFRDHERLRFRRPPRASSAEQMVESQIIASRPDKAKDVGGRAADQGREMSEKRELGGKRSMAEQRENAPRFGGKLQSLCHPRDSGTDSEAGAKQQPTSDDADLATATRRPETKEETALHFWELMEVNDTGATVRTVCSTRDCFRGHRERFPGIPRVGQARTAVASECAAVDEDEEFVLV